MRYSVITPAYNAESFVNDFICMIDNIPYNDFEVIIIDDCSTDQTFSLLEKRRQNRTHNIVIKQTEANGGAGSARNVGLQAANGEYILFIDIDDKIRENIFDRLDTALKNTDADCILFDAATVVDENKHERIKTQLNNTGGLITREDALVFTGGSVWGKLYKRSIQKDNDICFPPIRRFEDMAFNKIMLSQCMSIVYVPEVFYYYCINASSTVHRLKKDAYLYPIAAFRYMLPQIDSKLHPYLTLQFMNDIVYFCSMNIIESGYDNQTIKKTILESITEFGYYKSHKKEYLKYANIYVRVICYLFDKESFGLLRLMAYIKGKI